MKIRPLRIIDVYGVLDRCAECGAYAAFLVGKGKRSIVCTQCANAVLDTDAAFAVWNKEQRASIAARSKKKTRKIKRKQGE